MNSFTSLSSINFANIFNKTADYSRMTMGIAVSAILLLIAALVYWLMSEDDFDLIKVVNDQDQPSGFGMAPLAVGFVCLLTVLGSIVYGIYNLTNFPLRALNRDGKTFFENSANIFHFKDGTEALQMKAQYLFSLLINSSLSISQAGIYEFDVSVTNAESENFKLEGMLKEPGLFEIICEINANGYNYIPLPQGGSYFKKGRINVVRNINEIKDDKVLTELITEISAILNNKNLISKSFDQIIWTFSECVKRDQMPTFLQDLIMKITNAIKECPWGVDSEAVIVHVYDLGNDKNEDVKLPQGSNIYDLYWKMYSVDFKRKFALIFDKEHLKWSSEPLVTGVRIYKKDLSGLPEDGSTITDSELFILKLCHFSLDKAQFYLTKTSPKS